MSCSLSLKMHNKLIIDTASKICTSDASYVTDEYKQSKREKNMNLRALRSHNSEIVCYIHLFLYYWKANPKYLHRKRWHFKCRCFVTNEII